MVKHPGWRTLALVLWVAAGLTLWFVGLTWHWPYFEIVVMVVVLGINVPIAIRRRRQQAAAESTELIVPTGFPALPPESQH